VGKEERLLYGLLGAMLAALLAAGFLAQGFAATLRGLWQLQLHPGRLLNDFTTIAGEGAALVNAVLAAAIALALVRLNRVRLSGPTVAAVFTILGFGLFGKTPTNILPIILGVFLSARLAGKRFDEYILIALFGTALGPLVTMLAFELVASPWAGIPLAAAGGVLAGMLLPPLALVMLRLHQGYSLYNIGLTAGFLGVLVAAVVAASPGAPDMGARWNETPSLLLLLLAPALSVLLVAAGLAMGPRGAWGGLRKILRLSGRLPSDFMDAAGVPAGLLNMGIMGLAASLYVMAVGGPPNGPVLGGILTVIGFASFGKHPRNAWPVLGGIVGATLLFGKSLAAPGPLLAALFGATLAPLAGEFGPIVGLAAGFLHLAMVERTAAWHLGMNLYNNGFAGGLTATFLVAVIEWYRSNVKGRRERAPRPPDRGGRGSP
jgi:hypothetical protein